MTAKTTAPKYDSQTSKEDEINALTAFRAQFTDSTYIASFLNPAVIEWVSGMIRNDFSPDLWDHLKGETTNERDGRLRAEWDRAHLTDDLSKANAAIASRDRMIEAKDRSFETASTDLIRTREMLKDVESDFVDKCAELNVAETNAEATIAARDAEIVRLKAMIFDLEHAGK